MFEKRKARKIDSILRSQQESRSLIMSELLLLLDSSIKGLDQLGTPTTAVDRAKAKHLQANYNYALSEIERRYAELECVVALSQADKEYENTLINETVSDVSEL